MRSPCGVRGPTCGGALRTSRLAGRTRRTALALALFALFAGCAAGEGEAGAVPPEGTEVGQRAPELRGTTAAGEPFVLADELDAPVVLTFYQGAYCGLCRERLSRLQEHLSAYRALEARVVAVTPDPPARSAELAASLGLEFPLVSVDSATLARWGIAPPGTFLLDAGGEVLFRHLGRNAGDRVPDASLITLLERRNRE